ncbi:uncharacterized protein LOC124794985 [Schistocerca piceifrons]|uniref:uncharacterized protein LOC124794985 n=1 Tax=Schistocerca piceifrons TaxID=274613 RepID=UPI001F5E83D0|nr:uncharacterized protein LOC124794985 [Schistocerca piceifrons]
MADSRQRGAGARSRGAESALSVQEQMRLLLEEGAKAPARSTGPLQLPPWYDADLYRQGQRFFAANYCAMFVAKLTGLLVLLAVPSVLRVLVHTRRSATPISSFKRYLSTVSHMLEWYSANADGDLADPSSRAFKSLTEVRGRHCAASRSAGSISQFDMAVTQFGFIGFTMVAPEKLGIERGGEEGIVHFWRVIGYVMGMEDRFNICRPDSVEETRQLCSMLLQQVFVPNLKKPPEDFATMSRAMLDGIWAILPAIDSDAVCAYVYSQLAGLPYDLDKLSKESRNAYEWQVYLVELMMTSWYGWILRLFFNFVVWLSIYITQKWQFLANYTLTDKVVHQNIYLAS